MRPHPRQCGAAAAPITNNDEQVPSCPVSCPLVATLAWLAPSMGTKLTADFFAVAVRMAALLEGMQDVELDSAELDELKVSMVMDAATHEKYYIQRIPSEVWLQAITSILRSAREG